ncbi:DNA ligase [Bienertia sinuspersici]
MPRYNETKSFARLRQEIDEIKKLKEQRDQGLNDKTDELNFQDVLGKDTHGYLRAYGPGKSITQHFKVKPS